MTSLSALQRARAYLARHGHQGGAAQDIHLPAPTGGLNTLDAGSAMPLSDCTAIYNAIPAELGLRTRLGYRETLTGLTGATDNQVRSLFYYHGSAKSGSADRLFAVTSAGIFDVTSSGQMYTGATPSAWLASFDYAPGDLALSGTAVYETQSTGTSGLVAPSGTDDFVDGGVTWSYLGEFLPASVTFATQTGDAGRGVFHAFTTTGGHFLAYTDEENGYHLYTESTDTWAAVTAVTGVDETTLVFVASWKHRLFFAKRDTAEAWYLDLASIQGAATKLNLEFAAKPRHGGDLVGIYNWTLDGGAGIDDHLVFVFRGGDIAIYQGTDPGLASTFALKGVWYAGAIPKGRHVVTSFGGDLLILTKNGIRPLSVLVNGGPEGSGQYVTKKISNLFNMLMLSKASLHGWSMHIHPEDNALVVTHPTTDGQNTEQLVMSLANGAWSRYRDLPIYSATAGGGKLYFADVNGRVHVNDGYVDGITLADPNTFSAIQWSVTTAFSNFGTPRKKQVHIVRPLMLSDGGTPSMATNARYDFDFSEPSAPDADLVEAGEWDGAVWDVDIWGGGYSATLPPRGATGLGTYVAVAVRGTATARTVLVGIDVSYEAGGLL